MIPTIAKVLAAAGGVASIGFGLWHFSVPRVWNWYSYIDPRAGELLLAVRAINFFFSLSLVLFGLMNLLLVFRRGFDRYSTLVVLGAGCALWLARVTLQLISPQGTMSVILRDSMLLSFMAVFFCHAFPLLSLFAGGKET